MKKLLLFFIPLLLSSCSITVREAQTYLKVHCPSTVYTDGFYCKDSRSYSNLLQSGSRVRVISLKTGKSITTAVFRREDIKGICVPERFRDMLGVEPFQQGLKWKGAV